jgi:hypothetical protein
MYQYVEEDGSGYVPDMEYFNEVSRIIKDGNISVIVAM